MIDFIKRNRTATISGLLILSAILLVLYFCLPRQYSFSGIVSHRELSILRGVYNDIQGIQNWRPRFANEEQIQLLTKRIRESDAADLISLQSQAPQSGMDASARQALEYQNVLVRELAAAKKLPSLKKLRGMTEEKCQQRIVRACEQIVNGKKSLFLSRLLAVLPDDKINDSNKAQALRNQQINNILWKYEIPQCPAVASGFWGPSYSRQANWIIRYCKGVEKDVIPLQNWYSEVKNYRLACYSLPAKPAPKYNLRWELADRQKSSQPGFIYDGWTVRGDYRLNLCQKVERGAVISYDTGIRFYEVYLLPSRNKYPQARGIRKANFKLYSATGKAETSNAETGKTVSGKAESDKAVEPLSVFVPAIAYAAPKVADFLHQMGIPKGFLVRIKSVTEDKRSRNLSILYYLEHPSVFQWKSGDRTLSFGPEDCSVKRIQEQLSAESQNDFVSLKKHVTNNLRQLKGFPCKVETTAQDGFATATLFPAKSLPLTFSLKWDDQAHLICLCARKPEELLALVQKFGQANEALEPLEPFMSITKLVLGSRKMEGRCQISKAAFETSKTSATNDISFKFWIYPNGKIEMNSLPAIELVKKQKLAKRPEAPAGMTAETLKQELDKILRNKYSSLAPYVQAIVGKTGENQLYFRLFLQISDYPTLDVGTWYYRADASLESQLDEALELDTARTDRGVFYAANTLWGKAYTHPRFGLIRSRLSVWNPRADSGNFGSVENVFRPFRTTLDIPWTEPLSVSKDNGWHMQTTDEVANQFDGSYRELSEGLGTVLKSLYGQTFQLEKDSEGWFESRPITIILSARCLKPFDLPFNFKAGQVRVSATEIKFPAHYRMSSDQTFWLPWTGVSNPELDMDFNRQSLAAGCVFTPPLPSLSEEIPQDGFSLEEHDAQILDDQQRQNLFGSETQAASDNPWVDWFCLRLNGKAGAKDRELGLAGKLYCMEDGYAAARGIVSSQKLEGGLSLLSDTSGESGEGGPICFQGDFRLQKNDSVLGVTTNLLGVPGHGNVGYKVKDKAYIGGEVASVFPILVPQIVSLEGESSLDMQDMEGDADGTIIHPFMNLVGTGKYTLNFWKRPENGGYKLHIEWIRPDGRTIVLDKEYPHASAVDSQELLEELQKENEKFDKEPEKEVAEATQAEAAQYAQIAKSYSSEQLPESEETGAPNADPLNADALASRVAARAKDFNETDDSEGGESENALEIKGSIRRFEENNEIVYVNKETNEEYFRLNKLDMGFRADESSDGYFGLIAKRKDGSGVIVENDIATVLSGYPEFLRVQCRSPRSVRKTERITKGQTFYNEILPYLPIDRNNQDGIDEEINALFACLEYLYRAVAGDNVGAAARNKNICQFDVQDSSREAILNISSIAKTNRVTEQVIIPCAIIPDPDMRKRVVADLAQRPVGDCDLRSVICGFVSDNGSYSVLARQRQEGSEQSAAALEAYTQDQPSEVCIFHDLSESGSAFYECCVWLLTQYRSKTVPLKSGLTEIFFGDSGIAILSHKGPGIEEPQICFLPDTTAKNAPQQPPYVIKQTDWLDWKSDTVRFLPQSLQSRDTRQNYPFANLASLLVTPWNRDDAKDLNLWRASPMGLLSELAQKRAAADRTETK